VHHDLEERFTSLEAEKEKVVGDFEEEKKARSQVDAAL